MYRVLNIMLAMLLGAVTARASPWWVSWNGDAYPETEGWTRWSSDPPAERWLEDGKLFIDSRAVPGAYEEYGQERPAQMTLAPGETFLMSFRVKVDDVIGTGHTDPGVWVWSDDQWAVGFDLGVDIIWSDYEPTKWASFTPGVFHDFLAASPDMRSYTLSIDGIPALEGSFCESLFYGPGAGWGDVMSGRSLSEWASVECGVVPEPSGILCMLGALCSCFRLRRSTPR